jgi:hypothetical protein
MLLRVNTTQKTAERVRGERLDAFKWREADLQQVLFSTLDRLIPDDELLVVTQSRRGQEAADLLALDAEGKLFIFELKAWEAQSENLLQVLRYGQIFGTYAYDDLERLFQQTHKGSITLQEAHRQKFQVELPSDRFNHDQVFVVVTNGIDVKTRQAVQYWRTRKLDVRPWVYRVYRDANGDMLLEMATFRVTDNPIEDVAEGYYVLNTNYANDKQDDEDMLADGKAAAYYEPWKFSIERLSKGDVVFLYRSGKGIVGVGKANGKLDKLPYHGDPAEDEQEYSMKLDAFVQIDPPVRASEIKNVTGINYRFMQTMFGLDKEAGPKLHKYVLSSANYPI